jgi:hypothetical protein
MPGTKKKWGTLVDAVMRNDAAGVTTAAAALKLSRKKEYYDACLTAIRNEASDALDALMTAGDGFNFCSIMDHVPPRVHLVSKEGAENSKLAEQLIKEAYASPKAEALLLVLHKHRTKGTFGYVNNFLPVESLLNKDSPIGLLKAVLKDKNDSSAFPTCIEKIGLADTTKLEFILTFASTNNGFHIIALADALAVVAGRGTAEDMDKAALLLAHDADANYKNAEALHAAALNGHQAMVNLLLPHVSLDSHGRDIATQLKYENADPAIIDSIRAAMQKAPAQQPAAQTTTTSDHLKRLDADLLEDVRTLSDGSTLTTLFNFTTQQQIVTKEKGDVISPPSIVGFDTLGKGVVDALQTKLDALAEPAANEKAPRLNRLRPVQRA